VFVAHGQEGFTRLDAPEEGQGIPLNFLNADGTHALIVPGEPLKASVPRPERLRRPEKAPMAGKPILETDRLLLREFDEADAGPFYLLGSDPAILRYTGDPGGGLASVAQALEVLCSRPLADYRKHGFGRWACVLPASGEVIGFAGLKYLDDLAEVDLGYRFLPVYWGRGLATEASRAVLEYGFTHLGLRRVIGLVEPENVASVRVLEKLGLAFEEMVQYGDHQLARYAIQAWPRRSSDLPSTGPLDRPGGP
jgi:RimJ/RimL family protein N-acetyltransferase